jgi:pimeloyl-ACP methyl ester carboxylesterase
MTRWAARHERRGLLRRGSTPPIETPGGVASLVSVTIGGVEQWILVRGESATAPVVLFVHGGPGTSQLTSHRRNAAALESSFVVVNWDQRGAGKSFRAASDPSGMHLDQFVDDACELASLLARRFGQDKIVLIGHSWGSVVGLLAAARRPALFHAYVGIGQVTDMRAGEAASYAWALDEARRRGNGRARRALERIGPPPYVGDWRTATVTERKYVARFGGEMYGNPLGAMGLVLSSLVVSREYTVADRLHYFSGILNSMRLLWPELMTVDLTRQVPCLEVPVVFMEGRHDHEVPSDLVPAYFDALDAPSKQLFWFERSAHLPHVEERDLFNERFTTAVAAFTTTTGRDRMSPTSR